MRVVVEREEREQRRRGERDREWVYDTAFAKREFGTFRYRFW